MRTILLTLRRLLPLALLAGLASPAAAQLRTGHAIPGFEGLEFAVLPQLGLSYENATTIYTASTQTDRDGNAVGSGSITSITNHNTFTYVTPWLLFGGNFVMRARIPLTNADPTPFSTGLSTDGLGLGDIYLQPVSIYWGGDLTQINIGYAYWASTGQFDFASNDNLGKGFDTHEFSLGITHYLSERREWHFSILGRYELHNDIDGADLQPGQDVILDWGVGRRLNERWNVGLVGYGVWQTARESGADSNQSAGYYGTAAVGAEARYAPKSFDSLFTVRGYQEFNAYNHPEGQRLIFALDLGF